MNNFRRAGVALFGWSLILILNINETRAQDQTINGNLTFGLSSQNALGYAPGIFMLGNTDDIFIRKFNSAFNQSELRISLGDDFQAEDRFSIGVNLPGNQWYSKMVVQADGKVGIGTSTPGAQLHVNGGAGVFGTNAVATNTDGHLSMGNIQADSAPNGSNWSNQTTFLLNGKDFTTIGFHDSMERVDFIKAGKGTIHLGYDGGFGRANIGLPFGIWNAQGNVGIGTVNPQEKLSINGKVRAHGIKVELDGWSDFVFEKEYRLMPLAHLEAYINKNGHLPEIPTAQQVAREGIELGEMNRKLLQKIEELSLYVIKQEKRMNEQETRFSRLEKLNGLLSDNISQLRQQLKKVNTKK